MFETLHILIIIINYHKGVRPIVENGGTEDSCKNTAAQSKKKQRNRRKPSSGSLSEDDLFVSSFGEGRRSTDNERATPSNERTPPSNETTTPDNSLSLSSKGNKKGGKNSKKKKRKNKERKDSCSGSEGEGSVKTATNSNMTDKKVCQTFTLHEVTIYLYTSNISRKNLLFKFCPHPVRYRETLQIFQSFARLNFLNFCLTFGNLKSFYFCIIIL